MAKVPLAWIFESGNISRMVRIETLQVQCSRKMPVTFASANRWLSVLVVACLHAVQTLPAQAVTIDEVVQETIGAPVYASDGHEVGEVVDVSVSDDGEIDAVRVKTGAFLGFGTRVLALPKDNFTVLQGAVVLDVPAEAIETLDPAGHAGMGPERER
jgi:sporulation protein YlmC with PRC-barrel domain